jgi:hypothetical protein
MRRLRVLAACTGSEVGPLRMMAVDHHGCLLHPGGGSDLNATNAMDPRPDGEVLGSPIRPERTAVGPCNAGGELRFAEEPIQALRGLRVSVAKVPWTGGERMSRRAGEERAIGGISLERPFSGAHCPGGGASGGGVPATVRLSDHYGHRIALLKAVTSKPWR